MSVVCKQSEKNGEMQKISLVTGTFHVFLIVQAVIIIPSLANSILWIFSKIPLKKLKSVLLCSVHP